VIIYKNFRKNPAGTFDTVKMVVETEREKGLLPT
jgi:hypothetical protein